MRAVYVGVVGFCLCSLFGCVPSKKVNLLQDGMTAGEISYDSVVSAYNNAPYLPILKPGDIVSIKVGSLTPADYDFVNEYQARLGVFGQLMERTTTTQQGSSNVQGGATGLGPNNPIFQRLYGFQLKSSGGVNLPYIGEVPVSGLTPDEAAKRIQDSLLDHFRSPIVRVELLNFTFSVVGEVGTPGRFTTFSPHLTVVEALLMAGNFTEFSDRAHVKVVRNSNGKQEVVYINLLDEKLIGSPNYYVQPGDLIVVPQLEAKASRLYLLPNANFILGIASSGISLWLLIDRLRQ